MSYNLFLDDEIDSYKVTWVRLPYVEWEIVRNFNNFIKVISVFGLQDFVSFDHDLGLEKTGYDCVKWLVDYCIERNIRFPKYEIHSKNPIGKANIEGYILSAKRMIETL